MVIFLMVAGLVPSSFAGDGMEVEQLEPIIDFDFAVILNNQSKTVTADLSFPGTFQVIPVVLIGNGNFSASMSRTTYGEVIYMYLQGFGVPSVAFNIGTTPVTMRVSSTISEVDDWAVGFLITGILVSLEEPPYAYNVSLTF
jgi:hypothetical protein